MRLFSFGIHADPPKSTIAWNHSKELSKENHGILKLANNLFLNVDYMFINKSILV